MSEHKHSHGDHDHGHEHHHPAPVAPASPDTSVDAGSQALAEALGSSFAIVKVVMAVLVVVFLCSGFFRVEPDQRAIILRLGKPVGTGEKALLGPGLHLGFPPPIDEVEKVSITGIQKVTSSVGWYYTTPEMELAGTEPPPQGALNPANEGYVLTADGNIIHTRATLSFHIDDPVRYVFSFVNASNVVQNALDNALIFTAARFKVDDILNRDIAGFRDAVRKRATELIDQQNVGVVVDDIVDLRSIPPRNLKQVFDGVVTAGQNRNKALNEARSYENQVVSKASADAESRVNLAESDRIRHVRETASQAERFAEILPTYQANPNLFTQSKLAESVGRMLTNKMDKWVLPAAAGGKSDQLWLQLNREPATPNPVMP
ncbi:MAG: protease modulator HflK [Verrucomicrobiota bacterium]